MAKAYNELHQKFREIGVLGSIASIAQWDNEVMMPIGGAKLRQEQMVFYQAKVTNG